MSTSFCATCGKVNRLNASFCAGCGANLVKPPAASPPTHLQMGQVMRGQYTLVRPLGQGGMGAVYLAAQSIAGRQRQVVIKEMLDYYDSSDPRAKVKANHRFKAEAGTLAALNISGIPQIFDYFSESGRNYIVMQFVEGQNLQAGLTCEDETGQLIPGRPYPAEQVRQWGVQLGKILENLAQQKIFHLDIKPANLIIDRGGDVWLVDFGTAQARGHVRPVGGQVGLQQSSVYGTMGYAPPEQINRQAEARSDVYALAATLYHLLTDDDPRSHPFDFPQLNQLPDGLQDTIQAALVEDVTQRLTAVEFRQQLETQSPANSAVFCWRDGTVCHTPQELVSPALRCWEEAKGYFSGGDWAEWFKAIHHNKALAHLTKARTHYHPLDVALDTFLRLLSPTLPPAMPQFTPAHLDFGLVAWHVQKKLTVLVENGGAGYMYGYFIKVPPWLTISPNQLDTLDKQTFQVTLDTNHLPVGQQLYQENLALDLKNGQAALLPVKVTVPPLSLWQRWAVSLDWAALGIVTAVLLFGGTRIFIEMLVKLRHFMMTGRSELFLGVGLVALIFVLNGWFTLLVNRRKFIFGYDIFLGGFLLPWVYDFTGAAVGSLLLAVSVGLSFTADIWFGLVPSVAATAVISLLLTIGLHPPGGTKNRVGSGLFGVMIFIAVSLGVVWLAFQPNYRWRSIQTWLDNPPGSVSFNPTLVAAGPVVRRLSDGASVFALDSAQQQVAFAANGNVLASGDAQGRLSFWQVEDCVSGGAHCGQIIRALQGHTGAVTQIAAAGAGPWLATSAIDGSAAIWDMLSQTRLRLLTGHNGAVNTVAFSNDGALLATGANDRTARLWHVPSGKYLYNFAGHNQPVQAVAFLANDQFLAAGDKTGQLNLWRVSCYREAEKDCKSLVHSLSQSSAIQSMAAAPDGMRLAVGTTEGVITIRDFSTCADAVESCGQVIRILVGHRQPIISLAFSADGRTLASMSDGGLVRLWWVGY